MSESFFKSLSIPRFTLPPVVAAIGSRLPQWPHAVALTTALNTMAKMKFLAEDSLDLLEGRTFLIDVLDTGGRAAFTYRDRRFRPLFTVPENADLAFRAKLSAFLQLATRQEDPDTLFFNRELSIEGDTELGLIVKNMLDAMEWPRFSGLPAFRH